MRRDYLVVSRNLGQICGKSNNCLPSHYCKSNLNKLTLYQPAGTPKAAFQQYYKIPTVLSPARQHSSSSITMADLATPSAATMATANAGSESKDKAAPVAKPERPDEEQYKATLAKAEKELRVSEDRMVGFSIAHLLCAGCLHIRPRYADSRTEANQSET